MNIVFVDYKKMSPSVADTANDIAYLALSPFDAWHTVDKKLAGETLCVETVNEIRDAVTFRKHDADYWEGETTIANSMTYAQYCDRL